MTRRPQASVGIPRQGLHKITMMNDDVLGIRNKMASVTQLWRERAHMRQANLHWQRKSEHEAREALVLKNAAYMHQSTITQSSTPCQWWVMSGEV
jgi:hypothetical protein